MKKLLLTLICSFSFCSELVLYAITHPSCGHCQRWHNEVHSDYGSLANQHNLPKLQVVDFGKQDAGAWLEDHKINIEGFPTFVLMSDGKMISKFAGYADKSHFFGRLRS